MQELLRIVKKYTTMMLTKGATGGGEHVGTRLYLLNSSVDLQQC